MNLKKDYDAIVALRESAKDASAFKAFLRIILYLNRSLARAVASMERLLSFL